MKNVHPLSVLLPDNVTLIAVSKQQPDERITWALESGLRHFGENRIQEAIRHFRERRALYPDLVLHLIGPLQSNKTAEAVALFDVIHTVDRPKIAQALAAEMQKQRRFLPCFIQVNTGNEPQKSGVTFDELPDFLNLCCMEHGLDITGLMCIPPVNEPPAPHFRALKEAGEKLGLRHFSMGMSDDFSEAITCGATHIRVGSALFGSRGNP